MRNRINIYNNEQEINIKNRKSLSMTERLFFSEVQLSRNLAEFLAGPGSLGMFKQVIEVFPLGRMP